MLTNLVYLFACYWLLRTQGFCVYNMHLNFQNIFSGKKRTLYTSKYNNPRGWMGDKKNKLLLILLY